jgi:DNA-binding NtrC family response regulator
MRAPAHERREPERHGASKLRLQRAQRGDVAMIIMSVTQEHAVAVDAVLLDIRMPTMSGLALHQAVVHRRPELEGCIAFMSVEPDAPDVRPWLEHHQSTVFRKPLQLDALTRWIDGVAEERAGRRRAHG